MRARTIGSGGVGSQSWVLMSFVGWRPAREPGVEGFARISGRNQLSELLAFDREAFIDRCVESARDGRDDPGSGELGVPRDPIREVERCRQQLSMWNDAIHEPDFICPLRRELITREKIFECALATGQRGKRCVPPNVGVIPMLISGFAKLAWSLATAR